MTTLPSPATGLPVAFRVWTEQPGGRVRRRSTAARRRRRTEAPKHVLIIDTETRVDIGQGLLYGAYWFCASTPDGRLRCLEEGLFYADDLPDTSHDEYEVLQRYVIDHPARVDGSNPAARRGIRLLSRDEFMEDVVWRGGYQARATIVMFNAPFDWSRLAISAGKRRRARGSRTNQDPDEIRGPATGFSFAFYRRPKYRPGLGVDHLDSKRSMMRWISPAVIDVEDRQHLDDDVAFGGNILDLRTLVYALTSSSHSLKKACAAFGVEHGKATEPPHGEITVEHIDYCRDDVRATAELYEKTTAEYARHPISKPATQVYSSATIAKGYLTEMGLIPPLDRWPDFPSDQLGAAMSAFYGGRAEIRHRAEPLPVQLVDFTSMYPSVVALLNLWPLLTADRLDRVDATADVQQLLDTVTLEDCFNPQLWPQLCGFGLVAPKGDVLPIRGRYGHDSSFTIGLNHYTDPQPRWYALPELVESTLLTGRPPRVLQAYRYVPHGTQLGLQPIRLRGETIVDPARQDPFKLATEQRQRLKKTVPAGHTDDCGCPDCQRVNFLKVFANSGSYGVFAELNRNPAKAHTVDVHAGLPQSWPADIEVDEMPGVFCFPPFAACITAAARLMLALLERLVTYAGGSWVFCDTDSMAIVTTRDGGLIPATGDPHQLPDHTTAVRALSDHQLDSILQRFTQLNPYDRDAVPGTILRRVDDGRRTAFAISAKRYVIYDPDGLASYCRAVEAGQPSSLRDSGAILKRSEHGLGHLLNPLHPNDVDDRDWIDELWTVILALNAGLPVPWPDWIDRPALSRYTVSSPHLWEPFKTWNQGKPWAEQVKPFNFMLVAHVARGDRPINAGDDFQLLAPYTNKPEDWTDLEWIDRTDPAGPRWRISTGDVTDDAGRTVVVQTYADVIGLFRNHPEAKYADSHGQPCTGATVGALHRRDVRPTTISYIGKEADKIDEVQAGLVTAIDHVITSYTLLDRFHDLVLPATAHLTTSEIADRVKARGFHASRQAIVRAVQRSRRGATPRSDLRQAITDVALVEAAIRNRVYRDRPLALLHAHLDAVLRSGGCFVSGGWPHRPDLNDRMPLNRQRWTARAIAARLFREVRVFGWSAPRIRSRSASVCSCSPIASSNRPADW
jgi:hypothetical protein